MSRNRAIAKQHQRRLSHALNRGLRRGDSTTDANTAVTEIIVDDGGGSSEYYFDGGRWGATDGPLETATAAAAAAAVRTRFR